jgi:hypothetical protein
MVFMKPIILYLLGIAYLVFAGVTGCGGTPAPPSISATPTPLSLEEWKSISDISDKYDGATLDRLRMGDTRLKNERAWESYMKQNVIPERKKDIPGSPG